MAAVNNNFYSIDPQTQFYSVNLNQIRTQEEAEQIISQVKYDARIEVLKSIANYAVAGGSALLVAAAAIIAFKVSAFIIGIFAFPLAIIPPIYSLTTTVGGLAVGGLVGYAVYKRYSSQFVDQGKLHWNHAMHLLGQAEAVRARV